MPVPTSHGSGGISLGYYGRFMGRPSCPLSCSDPPCYDDVLRTHIIRILILYILLVQALSDSSSMTQILTEDFLQAAIVIMLTLLLLFQEELIAVMIIPLIFLGGMYCMVL